MIPNLKFDDKYLFELLCMCNYYLKMEGDKLLEYLPFSSTVNPSFWQKFTDIKLDIDKLEVTTRNIWGVFSNNSFNFCKTALLEIDSTSFNKECQSSFLPAYGVLLNKNTIEEFKECDKNELILEQGLNLWKVITSQSVLENPYFLNYFFILSFADLKKYHYYYWFCFPAPKLKIFLLNINPLCKEWSEDVPTELYKQYKQLPCNQKPFFIIKSGAVSGLEILSLQQLYEIEKSEDHYFAFSDPSHLKDIPGWPLRNYIAALLHHCPLVLGKVIKVISIRVGRRESTIHLNDSIVFTLKLPNDLNFEKKWIGWEKNESGKFCPRFSNMKKFLDPKCLAETSVDLNLKLMKWQLLPQIDLEKIKNTKCLLLGAGTLGCSVARTLLGWGVRNITFVDNACVSYSNPVRQSLFNYEDCIKNKSKAQTAAENLVKIFPGAKSIGYNFSIPMPGHPIGEILLPKVEEDVSLLTNLVIEHDIIFLLMDSRESRWLPTLLGSYFKKIVINAALGFDTYLVMRHGTRNDENIEEELPIHSEGLFAILGSKLGCYFCNDVTAPGNSLRYRTLDQQCTVTRPGISAIAAALAVELAISIIQHPDGPMAPAFYTSRNHLSSNEIHEDDDCILGILPHSIRGFLSKFSQVLPATERYKQCVACSEKVLEEYSRNGFEFLRNVFDSCKYLEELTGLTEMHNEIADLEVWDFDDDSSCSH